MARPSLHLCSLYQQQAEPQMGPNAPSARSSAGRQGYLWEYDGHLRPSRAKAVATPDGSPSCGKMKWSSPAEPARSCG